MEQNLGYTDRFIRLLAGAVLIVLFVAGVVAGTIGIITLIAGLIIMITAIIGFCPLYAAFGINSCGIKL
jgi:hypothetical protein